jgi:hypothetical protein
MKTRPFTKEYVLEAAKVNLERSIDFSIRKTTDRLPELVNDPEKSREIFEVLMQLNNARKKLDGLFE